MAFLIQMTSIHLEHLSASTVLKNNQNNNIVFGDWLSIDVNDNVIDLHHAFNFNINHFKYEGFHLNAQAMFWRSEVHRSFRVLIQI